MMRHDHSWQPGPFIPGYRELKSDGPQSVPTWGKSVPGSMLVLCPCGELRRLRVPSHVNSYLPDSSPPPSMVRYRMDIPLEEESGFHRGDA